MSDKEFQDVFKPIIDGFVWGSQQGHGSFLILEFGLPKVEFGTLRKANTDDKFPFDRFDSRQVTIKGEHSFFIYMANWKILAGENQLAHDESSREEISFALDFIDGQKLKSVTIDPTDKTTELRFDLGGTIKITNEDYADELNEMWNFYTTDDYVLTCRNDGTASFDKGSVEIGEENYVEIEKKITCPNTR